MIRFQVKAIETSHDRERGFLSIEGTMLNGEAEDAMLDVESGATEGKGRRLGGGKPLGSTSLGVPVEQDLMDKDSSKNGKHRHRY
ncbi:hypothetical protein BGZ60DRAFT_394763 [Tricladium varicosporioides]|nr:hypothetical protein BGZ60DRAFT_394763 [Hymenoscyphus varicosporioides]